MFKTIVPRIHRFIVFAGDTYYPSGGWTDYHSSYETKAEAQAVIKALDNDGDLTWSNGVDFYTGEVL